MHAAHAEGIANEVLAWGMALVASGQVAADGPEASIVPEALLCADGQGT